MQPRTFPNILAIGLITMLFACSKTAEEVEIPEEVDPYLDTTFISPKGVAWQAAIQTDGKILVAGQLLNGSDPQKPLSRLLKDGATDSTFNAQHNVWNYREVKTLSTLSSGKVLLGGLFDLDGKRVPFICFNANGSIDKSFVLPAGVNEPVSAVTAPDGRTYITGAYRNIDGSRRCVLVRLNANGTQDKQIIIGEQFSTVSNVARTPDGKLLVVGNFVHNEGQSRPYIIRLNADLSLDVSFQFQYQLLFEAGTGIRPGIVTAAGQPDGKVIVVGDFTGYKDFTSSNTYTAQGVLRLNNNGSVDNSFQIESSPRETALDVEVLRDGRILIAHNAGVLNKSDAALLYSSTGKRDTSLTALNPQTSVYGIMKQTDSTCLLWGHTGGHSIGIWRFKF